MFGIGPGELVVIIIVALVVLGPEKLPAVARTLGRITGEMRRMSTEFQRAMNLEIEPDMAPKTTPETTPEPADKTAADSAENPPQPNPAELAKAQAYIDESSAAVPEVVAGSAAGTSAPSKPAKERDPA